MCVSSEVDDANCAVHATYVCILQGRLTAAQRGSRHQTASVDCLAVMARAMQHTGQTAQPTQLQSCPSSLARAAVLGAVHDAAAPH